MGNTAFVFSRAVKNTSLNGARRGHISSAPGETGIGWLWPPERATGRDHGGCRSNGLTPIVARMLAPKVMQAWYPTPYTFFVPHPPLGERECEYSCVSSGVASGRWGALSLRPSLGEGRPRVGRATYDLPSFPVNHKRSCMASLYTSSHRELDEHPFCGLTKRRRDAEKTSFSLPAREKYGLAYPAVFFACARRARLHNGRVGLQESHPLRRGWQEQRFDGDSW